MDVDYGEVFGVDVPEADDWEDAGTEAGLGAEETGAEAQEQEPAGDAAAGGSEEPGAGTEEAPSLEALRRRAEEEARRRTEQEAEEVIAGTGLNNPYTGKPITTLAELREYREQFERERRREFQEGHGMDDRAYQSFVEELPEVKAAREAAQRAAAEGAKARLESDLKEVARLDPDVKALGDLARRPEYPRLCGLVEKGLSLPEAYKLVYFDRLSQRAAEATRQAALNAVNSKQHLAPTAARGGGAVTVPAEVAAEYRQFLPDATDAEIQKHYNRYLKKTTG